MNIFEILQPEHNKTKENRIYGVVLGKVTTIGENEDAGNVKLSFSWLMDSANNESNWARVAVPFAGNDRGAWFMPQVADEVLVVFLNGNINQPIVIGSLWNGKDRPPDKVASDKIVIQYNNENWICIDETGVQIQGEKIHLNPKG